MAKLVNCECGQVIRGNSDEEYVVRYRLRIPAAEGTR